jgi:transposase InsO family protein
LASGKLYLAAILDLFSRFVVGWAVSAVNDRHLTLKALGMGLKRRCPDAGLLHHSDQGCTYASEDYQRMLDANASRQHLVESSKDESGDWSDRATSSPRRAYKDLYTEERKPMPDKGAHDLRIGRDRYRALRQLERRHGKEKRG